MDFLKGLVYLETTKGEDSWCLAVEAPKDSSRTIIVKCKGRESCERLRKVSSNKKGGHWKFKAFRFNGNIEKMEVIERPLIKIIPDIPTNLYQYFPITELKKLEGWKWTD